MPQNISKFPKFPKISKYPPKTSQNFQKFVNFSKKSHFFSEKVRLFHLFQMFVNFLENSPQTGRNRKFPFSKYDVLPKSKRKALLLYLSYNTHFNLASSATKVRKLPAVRQIKKPRAAPRKIFFTTDERAIDASLCQTATSIIWQTGAADFFKLFGP